MEAKQQSIRLVDIETRPPFLTPFCLFLGDKSNMFQVTLTKHIPFQCILKWFLKKMRVFVRSLIFSRDPIQGKRGAGLDETIEELTSAGLGSSLIKDENG